MFCRSYNDFFQTLANKTNQLIIEALLKGPMSVSEIVEATKIEQSHISHSLKKLAECNFVDIEQKGKHRIYSLSKETILPILRIADNHAKHRCPVCTKVN